MSIRWSASPLYPGNLDLAATRRRRPHRVGLRHRLRSHLPGYRARVVPDAEPLLGLTATSAPIPRDQFSACVATTTAGERKRLGYLVLQTWRRGGTWR